MKKRMTAAALALCLLLTLFPVSAWALEESGELENGLKWSYHQSSGILTITGTGASEIPDKFMESLGSPSVESVVIKDGVTAIGSSAFEGCSLRNLEMADSVTSIGMAAFYGCYSLESIDLSQSLTEIEAVAFGECGALTGIVIPDGVTTIGMKAFSGCWELVNATIPDTVTSIGREAFAGCQKLTAIAIPSGVTAIKDSTFRDCRALASVDLPDTVTSIEASAFAGCDRLTGVVIPDGVAAIRSSTFSGCAALTSVTIPDTVTSIENNAFYGCSGLTEVTVPEAVTAIGESAFAGCASLAKLTLPSNPASMSIGDRAFSGCAALTCVSIPENTSVLGMGAFEGCMGLSAVYLPNSLTSIDPSCFDNCYLLSHIYYGGTEARWKDLVTDQLSSVAVTCEAAGLPADAGTASLVKTATELTEALKKSATVRLGGDIAATAALTIGAGVNTVLDLNGHTLTFPEAADPALKVSGSLILLDSAAMTSGSSAKGSLKAEKNALAVASGGSLTVKSGSLEGKETAVTVSAGGSASIDGGVLRGVKSALLVKGSGARADVGRASLYSTDGPVISGSAAAGDGGTVITVSGSSLEGKSATAGYLPCGIYHPQEGSLTVSSATIRADNGLGILMRSGSLDIFYAQFPMSTAPTAKGKVGDKDLELESGARILVDQKSACTGADSTTVRLLEPRYQGEFTPRFVCSDDYREVRTEEGGPYGAVIYRLEPKPTYTVTFQYDDGGVTADLAVATTTAGSVAADSWPADPARDGYEFTGWYTTLRTGGEKVTSAKIFTADTTLYARWKVPTRSVTFHHNYGAPPKTEVKSTSASGKVSGWPADPARTGYRFSGWYTAQTGGEERNKEYAFRADTTLYAQWTAIPKVTFHLNYPGAAAPTQVATNLRGKVERWPAAPTRAGYRFSGWYTAQTGGEKVTSTRTFDADATLYAQWTAIPIVTFHLNYPGAAAPTTTEADSSGKVAVWPADPARPGYAFHRWADRPSGGEERNKEYVFQADTTIYAQWLRTPTVIFHQNYEGAPAAVAITTNTERRVADWPADPTRKAFTFVDWFTQAQGGSPASPEYTFDDDTTLYAHWEPIPLSTITFDLNYENAPAAPAAMTTGEEGTLASLPAPPRDG